ncbi:hypothetical protein BC827DRAFT_1263627 [Russula dissimulans]|nr:hypothetical protein BC827DRAFT_1263627 [Russula dissimulans]
MSRNIVPLDGITEGTSLIVKLYDAANAVKVHKTRLVELSRQCGLVLSSVREYHSPSFAATSGGTEADEIERQACPIFLTISDTLFMSPRRAIERILERVSGWAKLSNTASMLKQNAIHHGIEECYRDLTTCTAKFMVAMSMVNTSQNHEKEQARQRDHRELVDMVIALREDVRNRNRNSSRNQSMASNPSQLHDPEPLIQELVRDSEGQSSIPIPAVMPPPAQRSKSMADFSGRVSKVSNHIVIEGNFLVFYPGEWTNHGDRVALGRLRNQSPDCQQRFKEWVEASVSIQHWNVLRMFGHVMVEGVIYSINPWMEHGNIREYLRRNPDADRTRLVGEVASGLEFLHDRDIVHGDLCSKNILISASGKAFVCGFGLFRFSNPTSNFSRARWFAPERISASSATSESVTREADIWSFGLLCLEVFTGEDPYSSYTDVYIPVVLNRGETPNHPGSKAIGLSSDMWEVMQSCWQVSPAERPSMSMILDIMRRLINVSPVSHPQPPGNRDLSIVSPTTTLLSPVTDVALLTESSPKSAGSSSPLAPPRSPILSKAPLTQESSPKSAGSSSPMAFQKSSSLSKAPPLAQESNLERLVPPFSILGRRQTDEPAPIGNYKRVSDPSTASGRLSPLQEDPSNPNIPDPPLSAPSQLTTAPRIPTQSRPSTSPGPSSAPPRRENLQRQFSESSSSSQSTSGNSELSTRRWWGFNSHKRSQTTPNTSPSVNDNPLPAGTPSGDKPSMYRTVPQTKRSTPSRSHTTPMKVPDVVTPPPLRQPSRSASVFTLPPPSRRWEPVSLTISKLMEDVASDSECILRPAVDGTVYAGNLQGFVFRIVNGSADLSKDHSFKATFLTIYGLFASNGRLFNILKRQFESTDVNPIHARSRYDILLFIESWLRKGFEDEELELSLSIKEFAKAIRGSQTMEEKAAEVASLVDDRVHVRLRQPGACTRLRSEHVVRPQRVSPSQLAAALTVIEGDRFKYITYWDYVNFTRQGICPSRIEVFNTVHDLVTIWVKRAILEPSQLDERKRRYEEWIHVAQACRSLNNFSSTSAIVVALTSSIITTLPRTCDVPAKSTLSALEREIVPTNGAYQNALAQAQTKDLIPWLDPHLTYLNLTFARSNPIVEVDGHPLIEFKQCSALAEQIDTLVQFSPPHTRHGTRTDVLAYVEYSLKSSASDDCMRTAEARSTKLASDERFMVDHHRRMRALGIA